MIDGRLRGMTQQADDICTNGTDMLTRSAQECLVCLLVTDSESRVNEHFNSRNIPPRKGINEIATTNTFPIACGRRRPEGSINRAFWPGGR